MSIIQLCIVLFISNKLYLEKKRSLSFVEIVFKNFPQPPNKSVIAMKSIKVLYIPPVTNKNRILCKKLLTL